MFWSFKIIDFVKKKTIKYKRQKVEQKRFIHTQFKIKRNFILDKNELLMISKQFLNYFFLKAQFFSN